MIAVWIVVVILLGHWLADFVWQPHWMGMRKSSEWWVLWQHGARIAIGGAVVGGVIAAFLGGVGIGGLLAWAVLNGVAHVGIDAVTSRMTGKLWKAERVHDFFVVIGFDQWLHTAFAVSTFVWLVG